MRDTHAPLIALAVAVLSAVPSMPASVAAQGAPTSRRGERSPAALRDSLRAALSFFASFDHGFHADYAHGDRLMYSAASYRDLDEAMADVESPDIVIAKGQGRYGDALQFRKKNTQAVFYRAAVNVGYRPRNLSGTVSFWLSLSPDADLEPGYADPLQITDKAYNNDAIWVDFTRDDKPRHFRLGVFGDSAAWNPRNLSTEQDPFFNQRTVVVTEPPFARGQWTHVAIVFSRLGADSGGTAKLYLNGKLAGSADGIRESFTWEPALATIRLGVNYVGLFDELSTFTRPLSDAEVDALYRLDGGVGTLLK
ncbi:MAG: LamG-like jellyroll fold domain-containing protein [Gemmatimonadaceae bacterium]